MYVCMYVYDTLYIIRSMISFGLQISEILVIQWPLI